MTIRLRRVVLAFVIALVGNVSLFILATVTDSVAHPRSVIGEIVDVIFKPGEDFASTFISPGHDLAHFVVKPLLAFAFSIVF